MNFHSDKLNRLTKVTSLNITAFLLAGIIGFVVGAASHLLHLPVGPNITAPFVRALLTSLTVTVLAPASGFWIRFCVLVAVYLADLAVAIAFGFFLPISVGLVRFSTQESYWLTAGYYAVGASFVLGYASLAFFNRYQVQAVPAAGDETSTLAGPWPRFGARLIDLLLLNVISTLALGLLAATYAPSLYIAMQRHENVLVIVLAPVVALITACMMAATGTTIGKAIIGIKVTSLADRKPSFYFVREFRVWVFALALGLPMLQLFTFLRQYHVVASGKPATYEAGRALVEGRPSRLRGAAGFLVIALLVAAGALVTYASDVFDLRETALKPWKNPVSGRTAFIARTWDEAELEEADTRLFQFTSDTLMARAYLVYEKLETEEVDSVSYAHALADSLKTEVQLETLWAPLTVRGRSVLRAIGTSLQDADESVEITVIVKGRDTWRMLLFTRGRTPDQLPDKEFFVGEILGTAN